MINHCVVNSNRLLRLIGIKPNLDQLHNASFFEGVPTKNKQTNKPPFRFLDHKLHLFPTFEGGFPFLIGKTKTKKRKRSILALKYNFCGQKANS